MTTLFTRLWSRCVRVRARTAINLTPDRPTADDQLTLPTTVDRCLSLALRDAFAKDLPSSPDVLVH